MKRFIKCLFIVMMLFGCAKEAEKVINLNLDEYSKAIQEEYYDTFLTEMNESDFYTMFGLDPSQALQIEYREAFLDVKADVLVMIEVSDETLVEGVRTVLEKRLLEIQDEFETYIPEVYEIARKGEIVVEGKYVFMIVNENVDDIVADIKSQFIVEE